jgi:acyl carrier protein
MKAYHVIYRILTKELGIKKEMINDTAVFSNDFGLNDTELSILLYYVENHYNIDIPQNAVTLHSSINDLIESIQTIKTYQTIMV